MSRFIDHWREALGQPLPLIIALVVGLALGLLGAKITDGGAREPSASPVAKAQGERGEESGSVPGESPTKPRSAEDVAMKQLRREQRVISSALEKGVNRADSMGGSSAAAVLADSWWEAETAGSTEPFRMWSISKPVTAIALLEEKRKRGKPVEPVPVPMRHALDRSSNCAQRWMSLNLERLAGGREQGMEAFASAGKRGGASTGTEAQYEAPTDESCAGYLRKHGVQKPESEAILFGPVEWTAADGAAFAAALGGGEDYDRPGALVLELMRQEKVANTDPGSEDSVIADLQWGAGAAFPSEWQPAWKGGWGGSENNEYMASQIVALQVGDRVFGVSAMFSPVRQPERDSVGVGPEDQAIETIFEEIRGAIEKVTETR